jgi:transcriptional regulator with XRE-family HTH domain
MDIRRRVGLNLRSLRLARGWSQEALAFECGLHRTYVSGVERGVRNPTVLVLKILANALGAPAAALLEERPAKPAARKSVESGAGWLQRRANSAAVPASCRRFPCSANQGIALTYSETETAYRSGSSVAGLATD